MVHPDIFWFPPQNHCVFFVVDHRIILQKFCYVFLGMYGVWRMQTQLKWEKKSDEDNHVAENLPNILFACQYTEGKVFIFFKISETKRQPIRGCSLKMSCFLGGVWTPPPLDHRKSLFGWPPLPPWSSKITFWWATVIARVCLFVIYTLS